MQGCRREPPADMADVSDLPPLDFATNLYTPPPIGQVTNGQPTQMADAFPPLGDEPGWGTNLASDLPAMRETVVDGESGRLFAVGDSAALAQAAVEMLRDPQELERFSVRSREQVGRSGDWAAIGAEHARAYAALRLGRDE